MMQVLSSRIRTAHAPQMTTEQRDEWVARVDAVRVPLAAAVDAHRPLDAALTVATAARRAAARYGHSKLTAFKRDLKNLGQTEAQIHAIIPDRASTGGGGGGDPTPNE